MTGFAPLALALPALLAAASPAAGGGTSAGDEVPWTPETAEHLLERAGFGAAPDAVRAAVEAGREATLERLFAGPTRWRDPFFAERYAPQNRSRMDRDQARAMLDELGREALQEQQRERRNELRREDMLQMARYSAWWIGTLVDGDDPLRDRLTLFWQGHFTSSYDDVRDSYEMIEQHRLLREHALGSFDELLRGVARDAAMLEYLDNDANRRGRPNENFARELLELFSLGEGHYTEADVVAAARAFTGWTDRRGDFVFARGRHDDGEKTFLGRTGDLDGDDVLDVILEQEACPRHVVRELIAYLEGVEPDAARVEEYADLLRGSDWRVDAVLQRLFRDPAFYRDEVRGQRIAGPVDFLVGTARRLGTDPPGSLIDLGAALLGQKLFHPPNVVGWDGGRAWITTSTLMQRGNLAGLLVGTVGPGELASGGTDDLALDDAATTGDAMTDDAMTDDAMTDDAMTGDDVVPTSGGRRAMARPSRELRALAQFERLDWRPVLNLTARLEHLGARTDVEVVDALCDTLLAAPVGPETRAELLGHLARERESLSLPEGDFERAGPDGEHLLRRLAHVVLSLPEAQLH